MDSDSKGVNSSTYNLVIPSGKFFSTLEKVHSNPSKESKYDPKCGNESEGSTVEERYLAGSELPENYVEITQNGPVFNILEKLYRDSVKASKLDPECEHKGVEGEGHIVDERYLQGSEFPSHYVPITPKDPVFNILENLYRNSLRGSKYDPKRGEADSIVEERYLEGSEVPKHYVQITSNGPGFTMYEKSHCSSRKVSKSDPKCGNESEDKIVEERYLEGSEVPWSDYILDFNEMGTEKPRIRKPRNTLCKQLIIKRRRTTILPSYIAFM